MTRNIHKVQIFRLRKKLEEGDKEYYDNSIERINKKEKQLELLDV